MNLRKVVWLLQVAPLLAASPALSQNQRVQGHVSGVVSEISTAGGILLENGQRLQLWGLEISNKETASMLLRGQHIACAIIEERSTVFISDCVLFAQRDGVLRSRYRLDLFTWLGEFGAYSYTCSADDMARQIKEHANNYSYWCSDDSTPMRTLRARLR